jgi:hypothetical protein
MKFKLPALHEAVSTSKNLTKDDIRQYIFVWNGIAMTFMSPVFIVDLYEYVKQECKIDNEEELEKLSQVIDFLNGRAISISSWKELTSLCDIEFDEDEESLVINKIGHKLEVIFDDNFIGVQYFKQKITQYINTLSSKTVPADGLSFEGPVLKSIGNIFKTEAKSDTIRLFLIENSSFVRFQLSRKGYIFGIINIDGDAAHLNKDLTSGVHTQELIDNLNEGLDQVVFKEPELAKVEEGAPSSVLFSMDDDLNLED